MKNSFCFILKKIYGKVCLLLCFDEDWTWVSNSYFTFSLLYPHNHSFKINMACIYLLFYNVAFYIHSLNKPHESDEAQY